MKLYRFKTFRTSYFFPKIKDGQSFLYGLYTPYGIFAKAYWWLFRNCSLVRWLNKKEITEKDFSYKEINSLLPEGSLFSVNLGTPGREQKISLIGVEPDGKKFFAKYSESKEAMELTKNEIEVFKEHSQTGLVPTLYESVTNNQYCYLRTEYVEGNTLKSLFLTNKIVELAISISKIDYKENITQEKIQECFAHGDFCPWNMIDDGERIRMIDWELAGDMPLGYDIFTFICETSANFKRDKRLIESINENRNMILHYFSAFNLDNYIPYLKEFARIKADRERTKGDMYLHQKYTELLKTLQKEE